MPILKKEDIERIAQYERELGIDNGAPKGKHGVVIERAEVRQNKNTSASELFTLLRIKGGDGDNRTIPQTFRWNVSATKPDGSEKTAEELKRGNGFIRKQTLDFVRAALGKDMSSWPESVVGLPSGDATDDELAEVFASVADAIKGRPVEVTVTQQMRKDAATGERVETDFQNFSYAEYREETAFKL